MILPRYWAKAQTEERTPAGQRIPLAVWRWSERSADDARLQAQAALENIASRIRQGDPFPDRYTYGDRPLREKMIRTHRAADGYAAGTRLPTRRLHLVSPHSNAQIATGI